MLLIARTPEPAPGPSAPDMPQPPWQPEERRAPPVPRAPLAMAGETRDRKAVPPADPVEEVWRAEPAPASGPWETIVPVNGFAALGKIGPGLRTALNAYGGDVMAECSSGRNDVGQPQEEEGVVTEDTNPVLLLQLETLQGAVQIVGATVERRGSASEEVLACALAGLRGTVLTVPRASSGARHVLRFRLPETASPSAGR